MVFIPCSYVQRLIRSNFVCAVFPAAPTGLTLVGQAQPGHVTSMANHGLPVTLTTVGTHMVSLAAPGMSILIV